MAKLQSLLICLCATLWFAGFATALTEGEVANLISLQTLNNLATCAPSWTTGVTVNDSATICAWGQLACSADNNSVVSIDFTGCALTGPFPDLSNFTSLTSLLLRDNQFEGLVPDKFSGFSELRVVDITNNRLNGSVEAFFRGLAVQQFSGAGNLFTEPLPDEAYYGLLQKLDLSGNLITGSTPSSLFASGSFLTDLNLSNNQLVGPIPVSVFKSSLLVALRLNSNKLTGTVPAALFALPYLQILHLQDNFLGCPLPLPSGAFAPADCNLANNFWSPPFLSGSSCTISLPASCQTGLTSRNSTEMDAYCTDPRPSILAECLDKQWVLAAWVNVYQGDLVIEGTVALPAKSGLVINGSLTVALPVSNATTNLTLSAGSYLSVTGGAHFGPNTVLVIVPTGGELPILVNGTVSAEDMTSLVVDLSALADTPNPSEISLAQFSADSNSTFTTKSLTGNLDLYNAIRVQIGPFCSALTVVATPTGLYLDTELFQDDTVCGQAPLVAPPVLPPLGFDSGALIAGLFGGIVLVVVLFIALLLLHEDLRERVLPYNNP